MTKKSATCVRLTENGKIKLQALCEHFGFNQSTMIELLLTLYHEKIFFLKKGEPPDEEKLDEFRKRCANIQKDERKN